MPKYTDNQIMWYTLIAFVDRIAKKPAKGQETDLWGQLIRLGCGKNSGVMPLPRANVLKAQGFCQ